MQDLTRSLRTGCRRRSLEREVALAGFEQVADWLSTKSDASVQGELVNVSGEGISVETIYFDVPDTFDRPVLREWRPTAHVTGALSPVFGGELVLVPPPG
jgi:hypothetical protein